MADTIELLCHSYVWSRIGGWLGTFEFGRYVLLGSLGRGAMAEVFAARIDGPEGFSKRVAIKRIHPHFAAQPRFRQIFASEGRLAAVLEHANVINVHDLVDEDDVLGLVMELADAGSLRRLLRAAHARKESIPWPVIAKVGADVCAALAFAHGLSDIQGRPLSIVHRDISPENILLNRSGGVKLADFGIANARGKLDRGLAGDLAGKPEYMPREQYLGLPSDGRTDIFALGAVLYEMAVGERAFPIGHERAAASGGLRQPVTEMRHDLPRELAGAIEDALNDSLDARPTAEELGVALGQVSAGFAGPMAVGGLGRFISNLLPDSPIQPLPQSESLDALSARWSSPALQVQRAHEASALQSHGNTPAFDCESLTDAQQAMVCRCAVFEEFITIEAAAEVSGADQETAAALLAELCALGWINRISAPPALPDQVLFKLSPRARTLALGKLQRAPELQSAEECHARYFLRQGSTWAAGAQGHLGAGFRARIIQSKSDLLAIHQRALSSGSPVPLQVERALAAALVLDAVHFMDGDLEEQHTRWDATLAAANRLNVSRRPLIAGLCSRGILSRNRGLLSPAIEDLQRAVSLGVEEKDGRLESSARWALGSVFTDAGRYAEADRELRTAMELAIRYGDRRTEALAQGSLGVLALERGELEHAIQSYRHTAGQLAEMGDRRLEGVGLGLLGTIYLEYGRIPDALACHERSAAMLHEVGDARNEAIVLGYWAIDLWSSDSVPTAVMKLQEAIALFERVRDVRHISLARAVLAALLATRDQTEEAAALLAQAEQSLAELNDDVFQRAVKLHRGHLDLALARDSARTGHRADVVSHLHTARSRLPSEEAATLRLPDNDVRIAHHLLKQALLKESLALV